MATPHTRKKPRFDTRSVARRLDHMLDTVVQRGVYVVKRLDHQHYQVVEVKTQRLMIDHIPYKKAALSVCDKLNQRQQRPGSEHLQGISLKFRHLGKLINDCVYYAHTVNSTPDIVTRGAITARLHLARASIAQIEQSLRSVCDFDSQI